MDLVSTLVAMFGHDANALQDAIKPAEVVPSQLACWTCTLIYKRMRFQTENIRCFEFRSYTATASNSWLAGCSNPCHVCSTCLR